MPNELNLPFFEGSVSPSLICTRCGKIAELHIRTLLASISHQEGSFCFPCSEALLLNLQTQRYAAFEDAEEFIRIVVQQELRSELPQIDVRFQQHVLDDRLANLKNQADAELVEIEESRNNDAFSQKNGFQR